jgi:opacity protein-like surface antigen
MRTKLAKIFLLGNILTSGVVLGLDFDPTFYTGIEAQYNRYAGANRVTTASKTALTSVNNKSLFNKSGAGLGLFAGSRLVENFGVELGYTALSGAKFALNNPAFRTANVKSRNHNLYVDALGFIPVSSEVDIIGAVGIGRLSSKLSGGIQQLTAGVLGAKQDLLTRSHKTGLRLGLGAQYKVHENVGVRFMARHQKGNQLVKKINSATVSLFYQF